MKSGAQKSEALCKLGWGWANKYVAVSRLASTTTREPPKSRTLRERRKAVRFESAEV